MNSPQLRNLSRRNFLVSSGALVVGSYAYTTGFNPAFADSDQSLSASVYVAVSTDGTVTVTCHRSEMGQGIKTAVAQVVCDELEADWARVVVSQAEGEAAVLVEDEKTVSGKVERAKAEQQLRPTYKPAPDHPWRRGFKPEAAGVATG